MQMKEILENTVKKMKKHPNGKLHFFCAVKEVDDKRKL